MPFRAVNPPPAWKGRPTASITAFRNKSNRRYRVKIRNVAAAAAIVALMAGGLFADDAPRQTGPDLKGVRVLVCADYFDLMNIPAIGSSPPRAPRSAAAASTP